MEKSAIQRKAEKAWSRIEALGGHGVWDGEPVIISFARTSITDEDLRVFADFPFVQILDLSNTAIGDAGLAHLAHLTDLESLSVGNTKISQAAIAGFRRAHPTVEVHAEPPRKGRINPFTGEPIEEP